VTGDQKSNYLRSLQESVESVQRHLASATPARNRWRTAAFLVVFLAAAAVVVYTAVTGSTLAQIKAQLIAVQEELRQLRASAESVRESTRMAERAWVEIEPLKPVPFYLGDDFYLAGFRYDFYLKNTGKTAAAGIAMKLVDTMAGPALAGDLPGIRELQNGRAAQSPPPPTQSASQPQAIPADRVPKVLAPGAVAPVPWTLNAAGRRDGAHHYLIGRIDYTDAFSVNHWMTFCWVAVNPGGQLAYCKAGNEEDGNPENAPDTRR
jgi:hypothetical protein